MQNRQLDALVFITSFTKERGYPPSVRELGKEIGVSSSSTVFKFLNKCVEDGYVEIDAKIARSMRVSILGKKLMASNKRVG